MEFSIGVTGSGSAITSSNCPVCAGYGKELGVDGEIVDCLECAGVGVPASVEEENEQPDRRSGEVGEEVT